MNIIKAVTTIGSWTLVYRITSILRDSMQAAALGAGMFADAFAIVFKLANILRKMFAEGAFNASFLPIFTSTLNAKGKDEASKLASQIFTCLTIILTFITLVCLIYFDYIIMGYAPGFRGDPEKFAHTVSLGRICFPFVAVSFIAAMLGAILNSVNRFAMPAAAQLSLNICVVSAVIIGAMKFPSVAYTMVWATLISGFLQVAILWWNVSKLGFKIRFSLPVTFPEVKVFFKKLLSGALGAGVWQVNIVIDIMVTTLLPTGSSSYVYYQEHINAIPLGILGIAFSTALLPPLTKAMHSDNKKEANSHFNFGMLFALILTIPSVCILCGMHEPITALFYGRGKFGPEQVAAAAPTLTAFAVGLPAYMLTKVFSSAFFASKNTKVPFRGGMISIVTNLVFIVLLLPLMKHVGIALATSIAAWFNAIYLFVRLKDIKAVKVENATWKQILLQSLTGFAMLAAIIYMMPIATPYYSMNELSRLLAVLAVGTTSVVVFYIFGKAMGIFKFMKNNKEIAES